MWLIDDKAWLTVLKDNQGMFSEILTMNSFIKAVCFALHLALHLR